MERRSWTATMWGMIPAVIAVFPMLVVALIKWARSTPQEEAEFWARTPDSIDFIVGK